MNSFYTQEELQSLGFKELGENVLISRKASFYNIHEISIGSHVRIDDFCILSGDIQLGSHIHIAAYCALYGAFGIEMEDYTGLSARCTVYSATDDFGGNFLVGPMIDFKKTNVTGGRVVIKKYSSIGANCVILPSVTIEVGVAVGSMSFINRNLGEWGIYFGIPVKKIAEREKGLLKLIENEE